MPARCEGPIAQFELHEINDEQRAFSYTGVPTEETSLQPNEPHTELRNDEDAACAADANGNLQGLPRRQQVDEFYSTSSPLPLMETRYLNPNIVRGNITSTSGESVGGLNGDETIQAASSLLGCSVLTDASENSQQDKVKVEVDFVKTIDPPLPVDNFEYDPIETPVAEAEGHRKLDFKPVTIRNWFLLLTLGFFIICIGGIAAMIFLGHKNVDGFHVQTSRNHLAFRYVPAAIGTLTTIWWRTVISTLGRMTPYISMAAQAPVSKGSSHRIRRTLNNNYADNIFTWNFWSMATNGHWLLFISVLVQRLMMIFIVPLKASFISIVADKNGWTIIVLPKVGYALMSIYATLICVAIWMLIRLWDRDTGVKWDPVSVADQLTLVQRSNLLGMYQGLEFANQQQCAEVLKERSPQYGSLRLGYWKHRTNGTIWHGLACIPPPPGSDGRVAAIKSQARLRRILLEDRQGNAGNGEDYTEMPIDFRQEHVRKPEWFRYKSVMFLLTDLALVIFSTLLIVVVALIIAGLAKHRIQAGFNSAFTNWTSLAGLLDVSRDLRLGLLSRSVDTNVTNILTDITTGQIGNFEEAFIYRFLPVTLMSLFSWLWINADLFYRAIEPFAGMNEPALATSNLLLDYPSAPPILITLNALSNGHWRVALFSTLALASSVPPIVATGVFVSTPTPSGFIVSIAPVNFWASFSILILYVFCMPIARPTSGYRLPRGVQSISDVLSYCYESRILGDLGPDDKPIFSAQDIGDGRVHLESRIHLAKKNYVFGLYLGQDGKRHMGFDVAIRNDADGPQVDVTRFDPGTGIRNLLFWRKPRVLRMEV